MHPTDRTPARPEDPSPAATDGNGPLWARHDAVRARIDAAARACGRDPDDILLLAISKTFDADAVLELAATGQNAFGENYVQEALPKMAACGDRWAARASGRSAPHAGEPEAVTTSALSAASPPSATSATSAPPAPSALPSLSWHFTGPIQTNKTRPIAEHFDWVHTVDREKIAQRLSAQRPAALPPLQVCIQVDVSGESTKSGCDPDEAVGLGSAIVALPGLRLRGVMAIPAPTDDRTLQRTQFARVRAVFERMRDAGLPVDTLSMGMSGDLESAIEEGATIVRVGTALFGMRPRTADVRPMDVRAEDA
jgi:PLP dependent protein